MFKGEVTTMEETTVDIEKIMEEIRADIAKQPPMDIPAFDSLISEVADNNSGFSASPISGLLKEEVRYLRENYNYSYYSPVPGGIRGFIKKVIRRLVKCVVFNLVAHLNSFNFCVAEAAEMTRRILEEQQEEIQQLKQELAALRQQNEALSDQQKNN